MDRVPPGTTYPEVARRVADVTRSPELAGCCNLLVDATGVGRAMVDLLRKAGLRYTVFPAILTGGAVETFSLGFSYLPKRDLIMGLQIALQRGPLQIKTGLEHGPTLISELAEMRVRVAARGSEQVDWQQGSRNDLVFAVALYC